MTYPPTISSKILLTSHFRAVSATNPVTYPGQAVKNAQIVSQSLVWEKKAPRHPCPSFKCSTMWPQVAVILPMSKRLVRLATIGSRIRLIIWRIRSGSSMATNWALSWWMRCWEIWIISTGIEKRGKWLESSYNLRNRSTNSSANSATGLPTMRPLLRKISRH